MNREPDFKNGKMMTLRMLMVFFVNTFIVSAVVSAQSTTLTNPILAGFYPDPSVLKVESSALLFFKITKRY